MHITRTLRLEVMTRRKQTNQLSVSAIGDAEPCVERRAQPLTERWGFGVLAPICGRPLGSARRRWPRGPGPIGTAPRRAPPAAPPPGAPGPDTSDGTCGRESRAWPGSDWPGKQKWGPQKRVTQKRGAKNSLPLEGSRKGSPTNSLPLEGNTTRCWLQGLHKMVGKKRARESMLCPKMEDPHPYSVFERPLHQGQQLAQGSCPTGTKPAQSQELAVQSPAFCRRMLSSSPSG